jgi:predicted nucleotidyltransferase
MVRFSEEDEVIRRFKERVTDALGGRLDKIILFGSRSRGDADEDSDFDFLVLVKRPGEEDRDRIRDIAWAVSLEYDTVVTTLVSAEENFREDRYFYLYENIHKEGRVV